MEITDWIEVFRAGDYPQGRFTKEDLKHIAESYDPEWHEAPVVIGHPKEDSPAWGWVRAVRAAGDRLLVRLGQLAPEFVQAVRKGRFKKVSVALMKTEKGWYLRHIGFLGAAPPQVKGLAPVKLSSEDEFYEYESEVVLFAEPPGLMSLPVAEPDEPWDADDARRAILDRYGWRGLAEYCLFVAREGDALPETMAAYRFPVADIVDGKPHIIPKAISAALGYLAGARGTRVPRRVRDEVLPKLKRLKAKIEKAKEAQMNEQQFQEELNKLRADYQAALKDLEKRLDKSQSEKEALQKKFSEELAASEAKLRARFQREREIERFIQENESRIPPAARPGLAAFMESLPDAETVVFTEEVDGEHRERKKSPFAFFQDMVRALPDMSHLFNEQVKGEFPEDDDEKRIRAYMSEHKVDYRTAVIELAREGKIGGAR